MAKKAGAKKAAAKKPLRKTSGKKAVKKTGPRSRRTGSDTLKIKTDKTTAAIKEFVAEVERAKKGKTGWTVTQRVKMESMTHALRAMARILRKDCGPDHGVPGD